MEARRRARDRDGLRAARGGNVDRTVGFADRTYVISNGELSTTLTPKDAEDTERMVAAYFGS